MALTKKDLNTIRQLVFSAEWQNIKNQLLADCPRDKVFTENAIVKNAIGFEFWRQAFDKLEYYANLESKRLPKAEDALQDLEYVSERAKPE
jgi:hypothetical protein